MTINYTYDPLNRLTAADYSTGDFYHYTYDPVGNRLTQTDLVNNQPITINYGYDIANRLTSVNGTTYTWDNNGNLLNDGTSSYAYDAANRLTHITQGSNTYSYTYNGLGDRLKQIANGQTTDYTLDLNAGLTQVLDDGTNTYTYGLDRILQQHGASTEYFLSDALGSVRQLADENANITLDQSYDPYGNVISSTGNGSTIYGYTGEIGDQDGLTYLRARYYSSDIARFLTKDSWQGDYNKPMSQNAWLYVDANPTNYTDPSGQYSQCDNNPVANNINFVDSNVKLSKGYWQNTYAAAGIAVQCWRDNWAWDLITSFKGDNAGRGPAQISKKQANTPYGEPIEGGKHGYGLLCYTLQSILGDDWMDCTICKIPKEMIREFGQNYEKYFKLEPVPDQTKMAWAVELMKRRIQMVTDVCKGCTHTEVYIAAALAQDGPSFTLSDMQGLGPAKAPDKTYNATKDWTDRFSIRKDINGTQLDRFTQAINGLTPLGWAIPDDIDMTYVRYLINLPINH